MKLPPDWSELIGLLCAERVRFVIVGAHALAVHGRPRATGDLDVLVEPSAANARRLGRALEQFGFPELARAAPRFAEPDQMATLGREPLRIDLLTSISGVSFDRAWKGRVVVAFGAIESAFSVAARAGVEAARLDRASGETIYEPVPNPNERGGDPQW